MISVSAIILSLSVQKLGFLPYTYFLSYMHALIVNTAALEKMARAKCMIFDFLTLQEATENFSEERKLGQGGFGIVYKVLNFFLFL